jgi:hypothetical protein
MLVVPPFCLFMYSTLPVAGRATSVTRFFQQSLPKYCSNFTKLRKVLPNVGFTNNYVIIMPKYNSYAIKVEKICPRLPIAFIVLQFLIRLYFLGLVVLFITLSTLLNKKQTFLPKWLVKIKTFRFYQNFTKKNSLPNFTKFFFQIWSHCGQQFSTIARRNTLNLSQVTWPQISQ